MPKTDKYNYGVVLDAGSSGTRAYIYKWLKNSLAAQDEGARARLPQLITNDKWTKKVHPGISTFGPIPEQVGDRHLKELVEHILKYVPRTAVADTPVFLLATAGMRLLPDDQREAVLRNVCTYLKDETNFYIPDCTLHVQVIPGETEGLYGWVAANYLLGGFDDPQKHDHGKGHHTYGFLDMGGASAQIAFAPNSTEAKLHADNLTLLRLRNVDGLPQEHRVFVTTWLGYGVNQARQRYVDTLLTQYKQEGLHEIPDPCLPAGAKLTIDGHLATNTTPTGQYLLGTGAFDECMTRTLPLLDKEKPCEDPPCLINGQHVPAIDFDVNHFVGVSEYWHTTHEIFEMDHKDKSYDLNTYQNRVNEFCSQDWNIIQADIADKLYGKKVDEKTAFEVCFKASWIINMLHDGIGVPRIGIEAGAADGTGVNGTKEIIKVGQEKGYLNPFQAVNRIKETEISWTMGKMVLYASADVPAYKQDALPVGFGSNVAGVPDDWHLPGGGRLQPNSQTIPDTSLKGKIKDALFHSDTPHRIPGFMFFLFIIGLLVFFLLRRRNGTTGNRNIRTARRKGSGTILEKLHGMFSKRSSSKDFDRTLEEGAQRLYDPNQFELAGIADSDSDDDGKKPMTRLGSGYVSPISRKGKPPSLSGRLTPELDRKGHLLRTESREGLDAMINGRKSRAGSPRRADR